MTSTCCFSDILKPFQGVLKALATRQSAPLQSAPQQPAEAAQRSTDSEAKPATETDTSGKVQLLSIRKKTTREFHVWDRVKETVASPARLQADMQQLAETLVKSKTEPVEVESLPDPSQLARSRSAIARAKTTHSQLKSLEVYLNQNEVKKA